MPVRRPCPVTRWPEPAGRVDARRAQHWRVWLCTLGPVLWLALWLASAGGFAQAQPITLQDDLGRSVSLARPPQRVVSLLPSLTETVCALDACGRLVGVDLYSNWPASVTALPRLGGLDDTPIERVLALKPDLVLLARSSRAAARLAALGIPTAALEPASLDDVERVLRQVARLLGQPQEQADAVWRAVQQQLDRAAAGVRPEARGQRVYFEVASGAYAAGPQSFIGGLLTRVGARNVVPQTLGAYPRLSPEFVLQAQPQRLMLGRRSLTEWRANPGWQILPAVRDGRVCAFDNPQMDMLVRPGPRLGEAGAVLAQCLNGAMDAELDAEPARANDGAWR